MMRMMPKLVLTPTLDMNTRERALVTNLIDAHVKFKRESDNDDKVSCQAFLTMLEDVAKGLNVECASREYRNGFTTNYRLLFPNTSRSYRTDVFEASTEQQRILYVNGERFEISGATLHGAEQLQAAWRDLSLALQPALLTQSHQPLEEVRSILARFDFSWAYFEKAYVSDLIEIEQVAREIIVMAAEQHQLLATAEESGEDVDAIVWQRNEFVRTIGRLNSVANNRRNGRDDLNATILEKAIAQQSCHRDCKSNNDSVALLFARDVQMSYDALRAYFHEAANVLEKVDPHLCNNQGLVERLVDWEESWEVGQTYLCNTHKLNAFSDVVSELGRVQEVAPELKQMCEDCDVELFLCIPRIIWLRFLAAPVECGELIKELLPHRFTAVASDDREQSSPAFQMDSELKNFQGHYQRTRRQLSSTHRSAWELLVRRVVLGTDRVKELYDQELPATLEGDASWLAVDGFMMELEHWSMELQRHSAEDWNRCSALFVQCLSEETGKPRQKEERFHV